MFRTVQRNHAACDRATEPEPHCRQLQSIGTAVLRAGLKNGSGTTFADTV
jgi:hypothetical protein